MKTKIAHHGTYYHVIGEAIISLHLSPADKDDPVPGYDSPLFVHGNHPITVAIEGQPEVGPDLNNFPGQDLGMLGSATGIDIFTIRGREESSHPGAETGKNLRSDKRSSTVGAI